MYTARCRGDPFGAREPRVCYDDALMRENGIDYQYAGHDSRIFRRWFQWFDLDREWDDTVEVLSAEFRFVCLGR